MTDGDASLLSFANNCSTLAIPLLISCNTIYNLTHPSADCISNPFRRPFCFLACCCSCLLLLFTTLIMVTKLSKVTMTELQMKLERCVNGT